MNKSYKLTAKYPYYIYVVWVFWVITAYSIITSSLNFSVAPLGGQLKGMVRAIFPEGWAFFTKSPREAQAVVYKINGQTLTPMTFLNASTENLLGLSRTSRYIGQEISRILVRVPKDNWENVIGSIEKNIPTKSYPVAMDDKPRYMVKGDYIIVKYKAIPWAWANSNQDQYNPYQIKRITIK